MNCAIALLLLAMPIESRSLTLHDSARSKDLAVRVTWPKTGGRYPVIVFSHGFRGSGDAMGPLVDYWAERGYVVIQPTHEDSIKLMALGHLRDALKTTGPNGFGAWQSRVEDCKFLFGALDEIEKKLPEVKGKMDHSKLAMSGHSFGAHTSNLIAGGRMMNRSFADKRPKAILLISPQGKGPAQNDDSWRDCTRPMMVVSGPEDKTPIDDPRTVHDPTRRQDPYRLSPPGDKYLVWIDGATHNFGGITGSFAWPGAGKPNAQHLQWVQQTTTAFWDAYLKHDPRAKQLLKTGFKQKGIAVLHR
jgi:predicted dienelactone hydrolase